MVMARRKKFVPKKRAVKVAVRRLRPVKVRPELYPVSTATNAYELLDEVIGAIMAEPARMDMHSWVKTQRMLDRIRRTDEHRPIPACGTVACIAGWMCAIRIPAMVLDTIKTDGAGMVEDTARALLGHCEGVTTLFSPFGNDLVGKPGTVEYARSVVRRIRKFQHAHHARLIATPLTQ